jgi:hypothetical protein
VATDDRPEISSLTDEDLAELYSWPHGQHVRLNMVLSATGEPVGLDGTSASISSAQDRRLLRLLRSHADVVLSGGASIRAEGWHLPPRGLLVVVSASGELPWSTCPDRSKVIVISSHQALSHFLRSQTGSVLCEGGIELARVVERIHGFDSVAVTTMAHEAAHLSAFGIVQTDFELTSELRDETPPATFSLWRRAVASRLRPQE